MGDSENYGWSNTGGGTNNYYYHNYNQNFNNNNQQPVSYTSQDAQQQQASAYNNNPPAVPQQAFRAPSSSSSFTNRISSGGNLAPGSQQDQFRTVSSPAGQQQQQHYLDVASAAAGSSQPGSGLSRDGSVISADSRVWYSPGGGGNGEVGGGFTERVVGLYRPPSPPRWTQGQLARNDSSSGDVLGQTQGFAGATGAQSHTLASHGDTGISSVGYAPSYEQYAAQGQQASSLSSYHQQQQQQQPHQDWTQQQQTAQYGQPPSLGTNPGLDGSVFHNVVATDAGFHGHDSQQQPASTTPAVAAAATASVAEDRSTSTSTRRPPPAPFNFDDSPAVSSRSAFSPRFLRSRGRTDSQAQDLLSPYTPSTATPWRSPQMGFPQPPPGYFASVNNTGGGDHHNGGNNNNNNNAANDDQQYDEYNQTNYNNNNHNNNGNRNSYAFYPVPGTPRQPPIHLMSWYAWRPAWIMYFFFLFGLLCAVGHHIFYSTLDGKLADRQLEMLRYGTVLAFAAKAGLVAAVVTAFRQRIWLTVRSKLLSVAALDSLFAATDDVTAMWNVEVYRSATVAMALASFVW